MLNSNFTDRFQRLLESGVAGRASSFASQLRLTSAQAAQRGIFNSSIHASQLTRAHEQELEARTIIAWESIVRVQRTLGIPPDDSLRQDFKRLITSQITSLSAALSQSLRQHLQRLPRNQDLSLEAERQRLIQKHDIEIDLYVDSLMTSNGNDSAPAQYNFYGAVGAVQTGANAQAHIVQNLSPTDRTAITESLTQIRDSLQLTTDIAETQKQELLDIAAECEGQVLSDSPNSTKLLAMLTVLGTTIQSIASARPAYAALKIALLPLGITLPYE